MACLFFYIAPLGLVLDIIGAALVFFNSPEATSIIYDYFEEEGKRIEKNIFKPKQNRAKVGFALLFCGFVLQLVGYFLTTSFSTCL